MRKLVLGSHVDIVAGEPEFDQQLVDRRGSAERFRAEDFAQCGIRSQLIVKPVAPSIMLKLDSANRDDVLGSFVVV
jgi:hypothetical protein